MKAFLRITLALILCLILSLLLIPGAFAEADQGSISVRFTNEKGYDLVGLHVFDADGNAVEPIETGSVYSYLLTPGTYTYAYRDSREIFVNIEETSFTVGGESLEIPLTLKASCEAFYFSGIITNPIYPGEDVESELLAAMPSREEIVDSFVQNQLAEAAGGTDSLSFGDQAAFFSSFATDDIAQLIRSDMIARTETITISFISDVLWDNATSEETIYDALVRAIAHTGNHREGDTLKNAMKSMGYGGAGEYTDDGKIQYNITFTFTYRTNAQQEQATSNAVMNLVDSLSLRGKSDYEKVSAIHKWLYENVNYDYNGTLQGLQYTDYSVFANRLAVCQGFATAYYRLCLAAGVDARYVTSNVFNHGWNVVKIGGMYYESDATWDSNEREAYDKPNVSLPAGLLPNFFLRGSDWWLANHTSPDDDTYSTIGDEFIRDSYTQVDPTYGLTIKILQGQYADFDQYTLSASDYDPATAGIAIDETNFPDPTFRAYVAANFDTDGIVGVLSADELAVVTMIDVSYNPIPSSDFQDWEDSYDILVPSVDPDVFDFPELDPVAASASMESGAGTQSLAFSETSAFMAPDENNVCTDGPVTSLKGIEYFTALENLICYGNRITELDLSRNPELIALACGLRLDDVNYGNKLSSLDLSNNKKLRYLACDGNLLTALDLSSNPDLEMLQCVGNALESLIINNSPKLSWLYCWDNKLTTLDLSGNPNLENLDCGINELTSLSVAANTKLKELECYHNAITELNVAANTELTYLGCKQNQLTALDVRNHAALKNISCSFNNLESLLLSGCDSLNYLYCFGNKLGSLDVSACTALTGLDCSGNALQSLDVSRNTMLERLWCSDNELSELDVSQNSALLLLSCYNNSLSRLDVSANTALRGIACQGNGLKALNISPCPVLTQLTADLTPEIKDGAVRYIDNTNSDTFRWLYYDETALLITPDATPGFVLPAELTRIEDSALADIPNLITVYIPNTVTYIDPNAFGEIGELYIFGQTGSAAETFAQGSAACSFIPAA